MPPYTISQNNLLEQETANFNREDWMGGTLPRSASSRSNNPVRGDTKISIHSRSTVQLSNNTDLQRCSPFRSVGGVSNLIQETS